jgi:uncharacterized protein
MKIGIISDTHGNVPMIRKALSYFDGADLIIHAGDVLYHAPRLGWTDEYNLIEANRIFNEIQTPMLFVEGNCDPQVYEELLDWSVRSPYAATILNGLSIMVTHGHLIDEDAMIKQAKKQKARIYISGHTHVPVLIEKDGVVLLNPGSPAIPKLEWKGKLLKSVAIIEDNNIKIIDIETGDIYKSFRL